MLTGHRPPLGIGIYPPPMVVTLPRIFWVGEMEIGDKCGSASMDISEALAPEQEQDWEGLARYVLVNIHQLWAVADVGSPCILAQED